MNFTKRILLIALPNGPELIRIRLDLALHAKLSVEFRIPPFSGGAYDNARVSV